ncbi:MAG: archaellin/type IV pilin N-terminal domain-containing protein [Thermoanaerobaculia bacterium]
MRISARIAKAISPIVGTIVMLPVTVVLELNVPVGSRGLRQMPSVMASLV